MPAAGGNGVTIRSLTETIAGVLGVEVVGSRRLGGGDVADAFRLDLDDGRVVFAKTHRDPPPGFFSTEAAGLRWLREPAAIAIPSVIAVSDGGGVTESGQDDHDPPYLVLEWIDAVRRPADRSIDEDLGRRLAALHRAGSTRFGREDRRTTGSRGLPNEPCDRWVEFYATQRLQPLHRLCHDQGALPSATLDLLADVMRRLSDFAGPPEPPARLHGDLWAGNRLVDADGESWLIDPAAHGGHREFDLAMMRLFGGYGEPCFEAYDDEFPLAAGWRERVPLHQLAPLVVHAVKFGGGYAAAVRRALDELMRSAR